MIDLGREYDSSCITSEPASGKDKPKKSYPSLYISGVDDIPELPDGDFYITAKVRVCRFTVDKKNDDNSLELEVMSMKPVGEAPSDEEVDEEMEMSELLEGGSAKKLAAAMGEDGEE